MLANCAESCSNKPPSQPGGHFEEYLEQQRSILRTPQMTLRIALNSSYGFERDMLTQYWECRPGDAYENEHDNYGGRTGVWGTGLTVRGMISLFMLVSVFMWFTLRASLFNIVKSDKLCRCCSKTDKNRFRKYSQKFLGTLCPYSLNMLMVLNSSYALDEDTEMYVADLDLMQTLFFFACIGLGLVCLALMIVAMLLAIAPSALVGCLQKCGCKRIPTPGQVIYGMFYGMLVFSLFVFAILGLISALALLAEAGGIGILFDVVFMLPKGSLGLPEFGLTISIGTVRIFKALFIVPQIVLELLEHVTSLVFSLCSLVLSCFDGSCFGMPSAAHQASKLEVAKEEIDDLESALAALKEGTEEFQAKQAEVDEALAKYDELLEKFEKANERFKKANDKLHEKLKAYLGEEKYSKYMERYQERKEKMQASMSSLKQKSLAKIEVGKEKVKASMSICNKTPANDASQISTPATQMASDKV